VLISELSGKGTVIQRAEATGLELDPGTAARVVERVKQLEHEGFHFEAADGSFDLLIRRETGDYAPLFRLESWRVIAEKREDGRVQTEATIKIWVDGSATSAPRRATARSTRWTRRCAPRSPRRIRTWATSGS
jgi:2-isopropylmalate synthase